jgi:zinc and cadmium transporter
MDAVIWSLASVAVVSLLSLSGIIVLSLKGSALQRVLLLLVSFSAGALFGDAFIHLIPEAVGDYGASLTVSLSLIAGIAAFFVLEKFVQWRHCHVPTSKEHPHPFTYMNLVGDAFHNLIDGVVIAGSYMASVPLGIATTIAVVFHEIPQELGDFGVLLHGGFTPRKAIVYNFATALTAFLGAIAALAFGSGIANFNEYVIPFTAGGFIYVAGSDLIPELHKETGAWRSLAQFLALGAGVLVMLALKSLG